MEIERQYLAALDLTHQMLAAANAQDWNALGSFENKRKAIIAAIPPITPALEPAAISRIALIIREIECESADILEQVQTFQKHARILLRLDKLTTA
jgi:Flagellar protein FliT